MGRRRLLPAVVGTLLLLGACSSPDAGTGGASAGAPVGGAVGAAAVGAPVAAADAQPASVGLSLGSVVEAAAAADEASEGVLGVVVVDLQTGERVEHGASAHVQPASLYKLFVAAAALHLVDLGIITLDEPVGGGACPTVETAMGYMITVSDNDCARSLATYLGWNVVESFVRQREYDDTSFELARTEAGYRVEGLETSASDVADLLADLVGGELLSPGSTEHLLGLLRDQHFASPLSEALGPDLPFAHKLGTLDDVSHDAGIVEVGDRRYVVVAVTSGWPSGAALRAEPLLSAVGTAARTYVESQSG